MSAEHRQPSVFIVAENAGRSRAGEVARPLHYFLGLRKRGLDAHLLCHERNKEQFEIDFPEHRDAMHFVPDTLLQRCCDKLSQRLPEKLSQVTTSALSWLLTQRAQRRWLCMRLREPGPAIVHQTPPISPRLPSMIYKIKAPVIIGPLNGDMNYPKEFSRREKSSLLGLEKLMRLLARPINRIFRGKLDANVLLYSNERTRAVLPEGYRGEAQPLVANAVDPEFWSARPKPSTNACIRFVSLGRLVRFKAIDLLLQAFAKVRAQRPAELEIIGSGCERKHLEQLCAQLGITQHVRFTGWLTEEDCRERLSQSDVFVFPSLREAGGAAVLEAMSMELPVIVTNWGGPAEYVSPEAGIRLDVAPRDEFLTGLTTAMLRLAESAELRREMGQCGRRRILKHYDWAQRLDRLEEIYANVSADWQEALARRGATA